MSTGCPYLSIRDDGPVILRRGSPWGPQVTRLDPPPTLPLEIVAL